MTNEIQILRDAISNVDTTFYWKDATPVYDNTPTLIGYRLNTCDTLHLRPNATIYLAGEGTFSIDDFSINEWVQISFTGDPDTLPKTATTRPIYFDHGTLKDTEANRTYEQTYQVDNLPLIWLRTPLSKEYQDDFSSLESIVDVELFILDYCYPVGAPEGVDKIWFSKESETEVVKPMENLWRKRILKYLKENSCIFGDMTEVKDTVRGRNFISQESEDGGTKSLFSEDLSGVQVRLDLPFRKHTQCNC